REGEDCTLHDKSGEEIHLYANLRSASACREYEYKKRRSRTRRDRRITCSKTGRGRAARLAVWRAVLRIYDDLSGDVGAVVLENAGVGLGGKRVPVGVAAVGELQLRE